MTGSQYILVAYMLGLGLLVGYAMLQIVQTHQAQARQAAQDRKDGGAL